MRSVDLTMGLQLRVLIIVTGLQDAATAGEASRRRGRGRSGPSRRRRLRMPRHHEFTHFLRRLPDNWRRPRLYHHSARRRSQLPRGPMHGSLLSTRVAPLSFRRPLPPRTRRLRPRALSRSKLHTRREAETAADEQEAVQLSALWRWTFSVSLCSCYRLPFHPR